MEQKRPGVEMEETLAVTADHGAGGAAELLLPSLGVIWHPDLSRIGTVAPFLFGRTKAAELSRLKPLFRPLGGHGESPLGDPRVSRSPIRVERTGDRTFQISPPDSRMRVTVNGAPVTAPMEVSLDALGDDIIITLSDSIVLSLFLCPAEPAPRPAENRMLGISRQIQAAWRAITKTAGTGLPVLIRGETGTGKELAAEALHLLSDRAERNLVSVNMATLSDELAAADLFGAIKGAFTGAVKDRAGLFESAADSSIFLDEIGDTPKPVQAMLLRVLEDGEYRRVGETKSRYANARVIAATDRPLGAGEFSQPLLRRLESMVIQLPPLKNRRVDIGVLAKHFIETGGYQAEMGAFAAQISRMALYDWPGNVRELRNAVQQIALGEPPDFTPRTERTETSGRSNISGGTMGTTSAANSAQGSPADTPKKAPRKAYRSAASITEDEMLAALNTCAWQIKETAAALNISRTALYGLMDKSDNVRRIEDISDDTIRRLMDANPGDFDTWVRALCVPRGALEKRVKSMG